MKTYLLRVRGGLDPSDGQAPVLLDIDREELSEGDEFPNEGEELRFRTCDGRDLKVPEYLRFRCIEAMTNHFYGSMWVVEQV